MVYFRENPHSIYLKSLFDKREAPSPHCIDRDVVLSFLRSEILFAGIDEEDFFVNFKRAAAEWILRQNLLGKELSLPSGRFAIDLHMCIFFYSFSFIYWTLTQAVSIS
jgi:hypothetical protein